MMAEVLRSLKSISSTMTMVFLTLPGLAVGQIYPDAISHFGALNGHAVFPFRLHTLLTYAFISRPAWAWVLSVVCLICAGLVIEPMLGHRQVGALVITSAFVAAVTFVSVPGEAGHLIGAVPVAWGFTGAAFVLGVKRWHTLGWFLKTYVVWTWLIILPFSLLAIVQPYEPVGIAQCAAVGVGTIFAGVNLVHSSQERPNHPLQPPAGGRCGVESTGTCARRG